MNRPWSHIPTPPHAPDRYPVPEPVIVDCDHVPERLDALETLDLMRPTILVVDRTGTIVQARGGSGRPLGYLPQELIGRNGIELVAPEDQLAMASFAAGCDAPLVASPEPFPLRLVGPDGVTTTWDCAPSGFAKSGGHGWVLILTSRKDQNPALEAMECFINGGSALDIAAVVARRHQISCVDGWRKTALVVYRSKPAGPNELHSWHLLDPAPGNEPALVEALRRCLNDPRAPWQNIAPGAAISSHDLPERLQLAADEAGLSHCSARGVGIEGESDLVFLRFSNFDHAQRSNGRLADRAVESVLQQALGVERSQSLLHDAVRLDPLTGIPNRLSFDEAIASTDPTAQPAVLFVDIDRFKAVNDTYGHTAGDATLREVADRIVRACRPQDMVARVGGDEFAVILHHVTPTEAERVADRIQRSMAVPLPSEIGPNSISVTVGIAAPDPDVPLTELVDLADHEMLTKKGPSGRDITPVAEAPLSLDSCPADIRSLGSPDFSGALEVPATTAIR